MLEGMCCQSHHRSQEHGKANTELISETSKGGRFLPKITRTCPSVPASFSSLCCSSHLSISVHPFFLSFYTTVWNFFLGSNIWNRRRPPLLPSAVASANCKSSWHRLSGSRSVRGSHARALESSDTHKAHTHTHTRAKYS